MRETIEKYIPSTNPKEVPEGYRLCEELGKQASIFPRNIVGCSTDKCPYNSQRGGSISSDPDEGFIPICHTKGLVDLTKEKSRT
tara:strand:- start:17 stop:268 length:252 start_codon:yes stop_codon:yes gene_type:complete